MAVAGPGVIALTDLRDAAAAALAPVEDTDPAVFAEIVEASVPPALIVRWDDPWLEPGVGLPTLGPCLYTARLQVVMLVARLEPGAGYDELDTLAAYVLTRMRADGTQWVLDSVTAPIQTDQAGIDLLRADATFTATTTV